MNAPGIIVMAKSPVPGRVKTRLSPPLTLLEAAAVAVASLADTLDAVASSAAPRRVLALDGEPGPWLPEGFQVIHQRGDGLAARLAAAWADAGGPGLQIGMDTPQVTPEVLNGGLDTLDHADAALGHATDGGWWAIALRGDLAPQRVFHGIATSRDDTGRRQHQRLVDLRLRVAQLPTLTDVDVFDDAVSVALTAGGTRFATAMDALRRVEPRHAC